MEQVPLDAIIVRDRCREDMGDIEPLAASIAAIGLLHPIVVTKDTHLVAGERRLAAVRKLGWSEVSVNRVETLTEAVDLIRAEGDENGHRKPYTPSEAVRQGRRMEEALRPAAEARREATQAKPGEQIGHHIGGAKFAPPKRDGFGRPIGEAEMTPPAKPEPKTRDAVGSAVGMSGFNYQKAKAVVEAAEVDPEQYGELVDRMNKTGKVDAAYKVVKQIEKAAERAEQAKQIDLDPALILGDFRTVGANIAEDSIDLVFTDPPYDEEAVQLYRDLGVFAARVLKPGGLCIAYSGHAHLPSVMAALAESLEYAWTLAIRHTGGELRFRKFNIRNAWKPLVMLYKPPLDLWWDWFSDITTGGKEKDEHEWQQAEAEAAHYIAALCPAGGVVVDPFSGGGTTLVAAKRLGLRYIGFEVDESAYNAAQVRLAK